jgi:hypothetical protein
MTTSIGTTWGGRSISNLPTEKGVSKETPFFGFCWDPHPPVQGKVIRQHLLCGFFGNVGRPTFAFYSKENKRIDKMFWFLYAGSSYNL